MKKYIAKRLLQLVPILLGITLLSFLLLHTTSSDVVDRMEENTGMIMSEEAKQQAREELGLNQPVLVQYGVWLKNMLCGNMGNSYVSGKPVLSIFLSKLPATMGLTIYSILVTILVSVPLGVLAAVKQNKVTDYSIRLLSFIGNSLPNFFAALLFIYFLSVKWKVFPVMGNSQDWKSAILPVLTLALSMTAKYIRQVRAAVLEELGKDYVQGARARGIRENRILWFSVMRSAMLTVLTLLSLSIGSLLGGTAVVESIFMWDGVGKMAVDAISMRDYPILQAYVVWMAVIYVLINLATDILYHYLDPRIRLGQEEG